MRVPGALQAKILEGTLPELQAHKRSELRKEWGPELSEVFQGLSVARLIFNTNRSEDSLIETSLHEALELRRSAPRKSSRRWAKSRARARVWVRVKV